MWIDARQRGSTVGCAARLEHLRPSRNLKWIINHMKKAKNIQHHGKSLSDILAAHELFFQGKDGGVRADLTGAEMSDADLQGVNLNGAILRNANLQGANLRKSKLASADLSGANLRKVD